MKALFSFALVAGTLALAQPARAGVDNLTYHGDTFRTGLNAHETVLTPAAVGRGLKRKFNTALDGVVFGQPLIATAEQTSGGTHDLAIVATMKDTVYALDASSGAVVWSAKLDGHGYKPVPAELKEKLKELMPPPAKKTPDVEVSETCPECGSPMKLRPSKRGYFLGCSKYPKCKGTREASPELLEQVEAT